MKHEWHILHYGLRSIMQTKIRVCQICYAIQEQATDYSWMRVVGYRWYPKIGRCRTHTDEEIAEMLNELLIDEKTYWKAVNATTHSSTGT